VFAANDQMALGLIRALVESGRRVPDDISVVGFDDIPEAGFFLPPLTTVRQDFEEVGRCSLRMLIGLMNINTGASPQLNVGTELVVRASTAPRGTAIGSPSVVIGAQKKIRHEK
jgi:DNA-binding LacI/PurR family transcriptional regulator